MPQPKNQPHTHANYSKFFSYINDTSSNLIFCVYYNTNIIFINILINLVSICQNEAIKKKKIKLSKYPELNRIKKTNESSYLK